jgi:perosamine synthetase
VITTPFSFVASANCICFEHARPVFVDIDPHTLNIDVDRIEQAISPRTRAILPVHVFGRPCDMPRILNIAKRHGLRVIEDACEAIGAKIGQRYAGTFGDAGTFAFYPNKQITTGEGGMIVTDSEEFAAYCRSARNQGRGANGGWLQHERIGYNYRLADINCALGRVQLDRIAEILATRERVALRYSRLLNELVPELITPPGAAPGMYLSWFLYVVLLPDYWTRVERDRILETLKASGIGCSNYFTPIHYQPFYRDTFGYRPGTFPITERIAERTIALPFFNRLADSDTEIVCLALRDALAGAHPSRTLRATVSS